MRKNSVSILIIGIFFFVLAINCGGMSDAQIEEMDKFYDNWHRSSVYDYDEDSLIIQLSNGVKFKVENITVFAMFDHVSILPIILSIKKG